MAGNRSSRNPTIPVFRNGAAPPPLRTLEEDLKRPLRIRCRKWYGKSEPTGTLEILLRNEKRIERTLRSKSQWDAIFELSPMAAWRETSQLHVQETNIVHLDFKNFYPSLLCTMDFPHPAQLRLVEHPHPNDTNCGMFRTLLHPCAKTPERLRHHHPFLIHNSTRTLPFLIGPENRPIETFLHGPELGIWNQWFDLEITEGLCSQSIAHPLAKQTHQALRELESATLSPEERETRKLEINLAFTTPKIQSPKSLPSPYGVHCLPAQITSVARAILCQTIHQVLTQFPTTQLLCVNTDGFLIETPDPKTLLQSLRDQHIVGENPGQLRHKSSGDEAIIIGPNLWWVLHNNQIVESSGIGQSPDPVPLFHIFGSEPHERVATKHLADFHHQLDHKTLHRSKFPPPDSFEEIPTIIRQEKLRSIGIIEKTIKLLRKRFPPATPT